MYTYRKIPNNKWREKLIKILLTDKPLYFMRIDTTGLDANKHNMIGISILKCEWEDGYLKKTGTYDSLIYTKAFITPFITELTGITHAMVAKAPQINDVMNEVRSFLGKDAYIMAFNTQFLGSFVKQYNLPIALTFDLNIMSQALCGGKCGYKHLATKFNTNNPARIFEQLLEMYPKGIIQTVKVSSVIYNGTDLIDEEGVLDEIDPDTLWDRKVM